jgi:hypothetical protein
MGENGTTRRRALIGGGGALVGALGVVGSAAPAAAGDNRDELDAAAIRQLSINYAIGTDAVSRGDLDTARARYQASFTPDATIGAGFDPAAPALTAQGPEEWLGVVAQAFEPYTATQHLLGTIDVVFPAGPGRRRQASMSTYLNATHVLAATKELSTVLGTYFDQVELIDRNWRIVDRFLQFTSFETSPRTLP